MLQIEYTDSLMALSTRSAVNVCAISSEGNCSAIDSFNGSPHLGDIYLLVQGLNKIYTFFCGCVDTVPDVIIHSWQLTEH